MASERATAPVQTETPHCLSRRANPVHGLRTAKARHQRHIHSHGEEPARQTAGLLASNEADPLACLTTQQDVGARLWQRSAGLRGNLGFGHSERAVI